MAKRRLNMAILAAIIAAVFIQISAAQTTHTVGDATGWTIASGGASFYSNWAANQSFAVDDALVFNFAANAHDVAKVTKADYDACSTTNPILLETLSPARIIINSTGDYYFISNFSGHCAAGQKLMIDVSAATDSLVPTVVAPPSPAATASLVPTVVLPAPSPAVTASPVPTVVLPRSPAATASPVPTVVASPSPVSAASPSPVAASLSPVSTPLGRPTTPPSNTTPVSPLPSGAKFNQRLKIGLGIATAATSFIIICSALCYCYRRKRGFWSNKIVIFQSNKAKQDEKMEAFIKNYQTLMPRRYSFAEIKKITHSFMDKLGQGGFGGVYKGKSPDGHAVAVKVLNKSIGDGEEFINEVASISKTSHLNIVTLLGFCYTRNRRALIYEYMPNGSLDKFIYKQESQQKNLRLGWKTLYDIAIGIARGLEYLHSGCNTRIVHFDIKPQNVLLDKDFRPKISDFCLAKLCKGRESIVSVLGARGTAGYIAPEVFMRSFGVVSYKSDVYSYGMMILEMFGGKDIDVGVSGSSEKYFPDSIYKHLESGQMNTTDENIITEEEETIRRMIIIGLWCIQTNPSDRPSMTRVVEMLEEEVQSLQIPPKPMLFSTSSAPAPTPPNYSNTLSSSL